MIVDYKERDKAIRHDIQFLPITSVAMKYGLTRQRVSQIVGQVTAYRKKYTNAGVISTLRTYVVEKCPVCLMDMYMLPSRPKVFCTKACRQFFLEEQKVLRQIARLEQDVEKRGGQI